VRRAGAALTEDAAPRTAATLPEASSADSPLRHEADKATAEAARARYLRPAPTWSARCRAAPLAAARALVECVRSFTDAGYFLEDLDGGRFALDEATGEVFAVDAPEPLATSPILDVLAWSLHGVRTNRSAHHRTRWDRGKACRSDGECPATIAPHRCSKHDCVEGFGEGAREARGWCRNSRCVGVDARAHVYDLATRAWALPLILEEGRFSSQKAKQRLEELIKRMRSEAPEDRPSLFFPVSSFPCRSPWCCRVWSLRPSLLRVPDERNTPGRRRRDPPRNAGWKRCGPWTTTPRRRPRGPPSSPAKPRRSRAPRRRSPGPRARSRRGTGQSVQVPATTSAPSSARAPARKL